jgi:hypothetical protein
LHSQMYECWKLWEKTFYICKMSVCICILCNRIDHLKRLKLKETSRFQILAEAFIWIQKFAFIFGQTKILIRTECSGDFDNYFLKIMNPIAQNNVYIVIFILENEIGSAIPNLFILVPNPWLSSFRGNMELLYLQYESRL